MIGLDITNLSLEEILGINFKCECGKEHSVEINSVKIGKNIINNLPDYLKEFSNKKVLIIQDINTRKAAGEKVEEILEDKFKLKTHVFKQNHLLPMSMHLEGFLLKLRKIQHLF